VKACGKVPGWGTPGQEVGEEKGGEEALQQKKLDLENVRIRKKRSTRKGEKTGQKARPHPPLVPYECAKKNQARNPRKKHKKLSENSSRTIQPEKKKTVVKRGKKKTRIMGGR